MKGKCEGDERYASKGRDERVKRLTRGLPLYVLPLPFVLVLFLVSVVVLLEDDARRAFLNCTGWKSQETWSRAKGLRKRISSSYSSSLFIRPLVLRLSSLVIILSFVGVLLLLPR
ncbi:hypothetical protein B0H16DRAFT_1022485 [Mycena metata]|uniref:Transmembrane protein n=1 Tax=Mycena metata TaxID=1033252 RepID=A0AAD7IIG0_9AGAR|nr:hypothetical protein B0H16DRAFT_1022485 [Mycena metata]